MAGGNSGFTIRTRGFDKEEVNEYISNLRKRMIEMETNLKASEKKAEEAVRAASTANERVEEAKKAGEERAEELETKLAIEQHTAETLHRQVEEIKAKLDAEKHKFSEMLKNGNGVNSEAKKAYSDIIAKGEADAKAIVAKAKAQAEEIISGAQTKREQAEKDLSEFLRLFNDELDSMNRSYGNLINSASLLLGANVQMTAPEFKAKAPEKAVQTEGPKPMPVPVPVFATVPEPIPKPAAKAELVEQTDEEEIPDFLKEDFVFSPVIQNSEPKFAAPNEEGIHREEEKQNLLEFPEFPQFPEVNDTAPSVAAAKNEKPFDSEKTDENTAFEEWSGNDFAQNIFASENKEKEEDSSDDDMDLFSSDLFSDILSDNDDDMTSDLSGGFFCEDITVTPLEDKTENKVSFDSGFTNGLIGQTMTSSMLGDDIDQSIRDAVHSAEEKFAVSPLAEWGSDMSAIDLDTLDLSDSINPQKHNDEDEIQIADFDSEESELQKALKEAEEALNSLGGSLGSVNPAPEPEKEESDSDVLSSVNPWEDLQKQLEELDRSGGASIENDEPVHEPSAHSADDSAIWNFGSAPEIESADDDMSSDVFSGFSGL